MTGDTDLGRMLANLDAQARPGDFVMVTLEEAPPLPVDALVQEREGVTVVVPREVADSQSWHYDVVLAWITLQVHSSLEAVGLTKEVSRALAEEGIPANMLAGYFHDHVLVPSDRRAHALRALGSLSARGASAPPA
jgi:hypothetical protein